MSLGWGFSFISAFALFSGATTFAAGEVTIDVPCNRGDVAGADAQYGKGTNVIGLRDCRTVAADTQKAVGDYLANKIDYYYQGIDLFLGEVPKTAAGAKQAAGSAFPVPVCNVLADPPEIETNHKGDSCGTYSQYKRDGYAEIIIDMKKGLGSRDNAYLRGGWVQAIQCFKAQIFSEVGRGKLTVSSACKPIAMDMQRHLAGLSDASKHDSGNLGKLSSAVNKRDVCNQSKDSTDPETMKLREHVCYVETAGALIEGGLFNNLVACEIFSRASTSYVAAYLDEEAKARFQQAKYKEVTETCMHEGEAVCFSQGLALKLVLPPPTMDCMSEKLNSCMDSGYAKFFTKHLRERFPSNGQCYRGSGYSS